ncbi:MAG: hypothetical protein JKX76_00750 [Colwellia sp.]|nr:hypothetical protein [Colwellia sp.]
MNITNFHNGLAPHIANSPEKLEKAYKNNTLNVIHHHFPTRRLVGIAAEKGYLNILKWATSLKKKPETDYQHEKLEWFANCCYQNNKRSFEKYPEEFVDSDIYANRYICMYFIPSLDKIGHDPVYPETSSIDRAALNGHDKILMFAMKLPRPLIPHAYTINKAAGLGMVNILEFARKIPLNKRLPGPIFPNNDAIERAAKNGYVNVLDFITRTIIAFKNKSPNARKRLGNGTGKMYINPRKMRNILQNGVNKAAAKGKFDVITWGLEYPEELGKQIKPEQKFVSIGYVRGHYSPNEIKKMKITKNVQWDL